MSLNVGGIYVACTDRDRVVEIIREYWLKRGAAPITRDPLDIEPLSLRTTAELGFIVSPPTCVKEGEGQEWVAICDSEQYNGDRQLAKHLAEALGASAVIYGMYGATNNADIEGFGSPLPDLPVCRRADAEENTGEEYIDDDKDYDAYDSCDEGVDEESFNYGGDWGEITRYVGEKFPYPFLYYSDFKNMENASEFLNNWTVFGFEKIPYIPGAHYSGPDEETFRRQREKNELQDCVKRGDLARIEEIYAGSPNIGDDTLSCVAGWGCDVFNPATRRLILAFAERILEKNKIKQVMTLAEAALLEDDDGLFERACAQMGADTARFSTSAFRFLQEAKDFERGYKLLRKTVSSPKCTPLDWNNLANALIPLVEQNRPADLVQLMEEASQYGLVNPPLWHNVACVWAKAGEIDRAIEAVACARRDGYDKMDAIAADDDLIALRGDPRFAAALEVPGSPERTPGEN